MKNKKFKIKNIVVAAAFLLIPVYSHAAVFIVGGEQKITSVNENVKIVVGIDTETERLNLFNVELDIPLGLDFVSLDKESSIINIWVEEPVFDSKTRKVSFVGGIPGGFIGRAGFVNVILKPVESGKYSLSIDSKSEAYLNDGVGTRALAGFEGIELEVKGRGLKSGIWALVFVSVVALFVIIWALRRKVSHA